MQKDSTGEENILKFEINNIGAIKNATIDIQGITIIAGENNVGKSTIGKALYAFIHNMEQWDKIYDNICSSRIEKLLYNNSILLDDWCIDNTIAKRRRTNRTGQLIEEYANDAEFRGKIEDYLLAEGVDNQKETENSLKKMLEKYFCDYLYLYAKEDTRKIFDREKEWVDSWLSGIVSAIKRLELDEIEIQKTYIESSLNEVFDFQYRKIGTGESEINYYMTVNEDTLRKVSFRVSDNGITMEIPLKVTNRVFFIESPKIYDYLSDTSFGYVQKEYLRYLMSPNIFKKKRITSPEMLKKESDEIISYDEISGLLNRLENVMGGRAEYLQKRGLEFKNDYLKEPIRAVNVSTGLKSLALLEYALRIGAIQKGDILILDEPEINLHPEWQVEYAKALVELQKIFDLKFIITSHSPYFMRAIEVFMDKEETMDCLNVYQVSKDEKTGEREVENVMYSEFGMTELYEQLSAPLEKIEELLNEKYGED